MKKLRLIILPLLLTLLIPVCNLSTTQAATLKAPAITAKQGKSNITVQWSKVSGAKGYVLYRKNSPSQSWKRLKVVNASTVKHYDKSISSGKNYYYTVRAYTTKSGKNIYGSYSKSGKNVIYLKEPKVSATKSHKSVTLKWNKTTGASGYEVYRKTTGGYSKIKTTTASSYTDTSVRANTSYTYAVRAYRKSGSRLFRSLYYDGANLLGVKTNKEPVVTPPVEEPEPEKPDINEMVESKVYFNDYGGILEIYNKSIYNFISVEYEIEFYDHNNELMWRIPRKFTGYLYSKMSNYDKLRLPENLNYSKYKINLSYIKTDSSALNGLDIGDIFTKDNKSYVRISNKSKKVLNMSCNVVLIHNNIPIKMRQLGFELNVNESKEFLISYDLIDETHNIVIAPIYILYS